MHTPVTPEELESSPLTL
ncbi:hypothetical protein L195_g021797 [Trifolium pratense]|uniref:Uncharacterized protein n=1 Tax=Trifolium pratense TaxID=57577 RepID=A0A2K3N665_TRIPR|nr:hypothetical protein L195_g021797 [Trifolium pratense]